MSTHSYMTLAGIVRRGWVRGGRIWPAVSPFHGLALILFVGLILRCWLATSQSAWLDEGVSLHMAALPLSAMNDAVRNDMHPPLYYGVLHVWLQLAGYGVFQARLLSVLCSVAAIGALYMLADLLFGAPIALCAAALLAISPVATWYADEIRMYAAVDLFSLLTVYTLVQAWRRGRVTWWLGYALCGALTVSLDTSGSYLLLAANLFYIFMIARRNALIQPWLLANILALLPCIPTLLLTRNQLANNLGELNWISGPTPQTVWSALTDLTSMNGNASFAAVLFVALGLIGGLAIFSDLRQRRFQDEYLLLALLILLPLAVPLMLSVIHPVFLLRTVQTALYGLLILFARGLVFLARRWMVAGIAAFASIVALNCTSLHAAAATTLKQDWQGLVAVAHQQVSPDSLLLLDPYWLRDPFNVYWRQYQPYVTQHDYPPITSSDDAKKVLGSYSSVWLIANNTGDNPPVDAATAYLSAHYGRVTTTKFYALTLYHYVASQTGIVVYAHVLPVRVQDGGTVAVVAETAPGAMCTASLFYIGDAGAAGWAASARPDGIDGTAAWRVRVVTNADAASVQVRCTLGGHTAMGMTRLFIAH